MTAVSVRGLERRFGYSAVLSGLDLEVEAGKRVVITGANGTGKTSLLRVLAGLLQPTAGEVAVMGGDPRAPSVRRRVGFVGHTPALYPRMTAAENLRFWSRMYDAPGGPARGRDLLDRLGLDPDDRRHVSAYSQGMRQRVAVARALCTAPELLLADEPVAGLDSAGTDGVTALMHQPPTVVAVTHDPMDFEGWDRYVLRDGRLEGTGTKEPES